MEISAENVEPRQIRLTITVPPERIERAMTEVAQVLARRERLTGYRPGKFPLARVVAVFGEEPIRKAAIEDLREQVVREAVLESAIQPGGPTSYEVVSEDPLTISALVPLEPEVRLGDYHSLRLPRPDAPDVSDEDVDDAVATWRRDMSTWQTVDVPAGSGDTMKVRLVGRLDDRAVFESDELELLLEPEAAVSAGLPGDVAAALVGLEAGSHHSFPIAYSELWSDPDLQGREVQFEADVLEVRTLVPPELTDEYVKEHAGADSLEELRGRVRDQMFVRALVGMSEQRAQQALEALAAVTDVSYAPALLEQEVAENLADLRRRVERQGFTWERWLEMQGRTSEQMWDEMVPVAEAGLAKQLALGEFVRLEGIDVSLAEVDAEIRRMAGRGPSRARSAAQREALRRSVRSRLLTNRALARLLDIMGNSPEDADGGGHDEGDAESAPLEAPAAETGAEPGKEPT